ncbi:hypothetical protein GCM10011365_13250 [Marinicella pacifica]|uniref:Uncharacterized protein n=1 Tax=Marinicella pacifica TaxID=1171543 RepID=A0A917CNA1_9GAMM|nr:hypothetical protein [Marinicella pacifica]GGF93369.1 hypothetical protein GCM10011365_13250 [Marinicella pacifica]
MIPRRKLKSVHENSVLKSFGECLKRKGLTFKIKSQPDPPDAFVEIDRKNTWVEITDAFYSQDVAISITSYAADITHRPSKGGYVKDPDETTRNKVETVIEKKLTKSTMIKIARSHGKGILLVGLFGPFFDIDEIGNNLTVAFKSKLQNQSVFDSIYLYEGCSENVHRYKKIL